MEYRKKEIIKVISKKSNQNSYLIINMVKQNKIDHLIKKISDNKTKVNITTLTKKKILIPSEQFIILINNFIYFFKENFYFIKNNSDYIIEILLQNNKYTKYLLTKKYIGNNKNIIYFSNNTKKLITSGFYSNIKKLSKKSKLIDNFVKENNINIKNNIDSLFNILIKISFCNANHFNLPLLFEDIDNYFKNTKSNNITSINNFYIKEWENMLNNYYKKINAINILLK